MESINTMVGKLEGIQQEGMMVDVESLEKIQDENTRPSKRTKDNMKKKATNHDIQDMKKIVLNITQLEVEAAKALKNLKNLN